MGPYPRFTLALLAGEPWGQLLVGKWILKS